MKKPPPQHTAATTPAFRGPSRSTHAPKIAADDPRKTKNSVYIQPSDVSFQSAGSDRTMPIARLSGSQNTLKPYAMPIDKCTASAAGGTSHRLNVGEATMRSFARTSAGATSVITARALAHPSDVPTAEAALKGCATSSATLLRLQQAARSASYARALAGAQN